MKQTQALILLFIGFLSTLFLFWHSERQMKKTYSNQISAFEKRLDSLEWVRDSLSDENFILETQLMRYELTFEHLREINPKAWDQSTYFISNFTE